MSGGVFAVSRGVFDHPVFADEPFTEREAWIWLIGEAAWKDRAVRVGKIVVNLNRGQCAHSVRFMADAWGWSKSRVDRFLNRLEIGTLIVTDSGTGVTTITICKYDEYQKVSLPSGTEGGTQNGTVAGQQRDRLENIQNIKEDSLSVPEEPTGKRPSKKRNQYPEDFEAFWRDYPRDPLMSKKEAFDAWKRIPEDERKAATDALPAFKAYCKKHPDYRPIHACRFLTKKRAEGFLAAPLSGTTTELRPVGYPTHIPPPDRARILWQTGLWQPSAWGPEPGEPGCRIPEPIQREWLAQKSPSLQERTG